MYREPTVKNKNAYATKNGRVIDQSIFCVLPWTLLSTTVDGVWARCCFDATNDYDWYYRQQDEPSFELMPGALGCTPGSRYAASNPGRVFGFMGAFNSPDMKHTRLSMLSGERPAACRYCFQREDSGAHSHRLAVNADFAEQGDIPSLLSATADDGELKWFPPYLDLRFGNTCNLACVMCAYPTSSKWGQKSHPQWTTAQIDPYLNDDQFWQELSENARHVHFAYFAGGEPFIQSGHYRALHAFTQSHSAENTALHYNSNLTMLPKHGFEQLQQFKSVVIAASCDGTSETFERIRVGGHWSTFVANLREAKKHVTVWLDVTMQRDNVGNIADLLAFARAEGVRARFENYVDYPLEFSARSLPVDKKQAYSASISRLIADCRQRSENRVAEELTRFLTYMNAKPLA